MAKNNKTRFFYILYSDKTWVFDQSERILSYIYIYIYIFAKERVIILFFCKLNKNHVLFLYMQNHAVPGLPVPLLFPCFTISSFTISITCM